MRRIAVLDIGKTNAKVLIVDLATGAEEVLARTPNAVVRDGPYPHHDLDMLWDFALSGLRLAAERGVDAVSITTHGAACVLVDAEGGLALPMLDYEHDGPDLLAAAYDAVRPGFAETGSPRLPVGLNLGAQVFWLSRAFPAEFARVRNVLMLAQYWAFRLSGVAVSEATSLGCHTDLWNPWEGRFSSLVSRMGWEGVFPPVRKAADVLGPVLPAVAEATGLALGTPVLCGIHDSNASLVPHLGEAPCGVLSTGTWMIVMALGGRAVELDASRDVLVNVNALGQPVPTARFMGGREMEEIMGGRIVEPSDGDLLGVLEGRVMAMPSLHPGTGPFPGKRFGWAGGEPEGGARMAAASFYAALMGAECLALAGAEGPVIVEGAFGGNLAFLRMLATATGRVVRGSGQGAGTGLGAALLAGPLEAEGVVAVEVRPEADPLWTGYVGAWREAVARWTAPR
ncbi:MAG: FGGY-family carbohydrate kinase [Tabrizicola sp.]|uniref:FGGY-family carbohydrate kinase n=1 Tax=Tabrizicola sp. TaxID=2005166 RepID=UPI002ABB6DFC|nr:FGGY-family carbohydrate kinase [Tabrizicola sp.]MDZ4085280.1 FGGY-family carbohydrate kinase [Tabrizicola sp.]